MDFFDMGIIDFAHAEWVDLGGAAVSMGLFLDEIALRQVFKLGAFQTSAGKQQSKSRGHL